MERLILRTKAGHFGLVAIGLLIAAYVGVRFGFLSSLVVAFTLLIVSVTCPRNPQQG